MEDAPKKYFRLSIGKEVRLKHAYYITCTDYTMDENGSIKEINCIYDPDTKGGWSKDGRKVKGTIQWVSVNHAVNAEIRLYNNLFIAEEPEMNGENFIQHLNPDSKEIITNAKLEFGLREAKSNIAFQFIRIGFKY